MYTKHWLTWQKWFLPTKKHKTKNYYTSAGLSRHASFQIGLLNQLQQRFQRKNNPSQQNDNKSSPTNNNSNNNKRKSQLWYPTHRVQVKRSKRYVRPRPRIPNLKKWHHIPLQVPQITCTEAYIWESGRALGDRIKEHPEAPSPIHQHSSSTGCPLTHSASTSYIKKH